MPLTAAGLVLLAVLGVSLLAVMPAGAAAGDGGFVNHPSLVPNTPERGYPIILGTPTFIDDNGNCPAQGCVQARQTFAVDMIDRYIISGGDFLNIELQDGSVISQPYLSIVDSATKQQVCTNLDVNNEVLAIAPGPLPKTAIIGGRFSSINGADGVDRPKTRVAMIHLDTCQVNANWTAGYIGSKVTELAVSGSRLFMGGDFTQVAGVNIDRLAELNHSTGALNTNFSFSFGGERSRTIVGLEANTAGTRLGIVHRATSINGRSMRGTAIFNISNPNSPTLTGHRMRTSTDAYSQYYDIQDGAISPDFTRIGIAQGTATVSDFVTVVPTTESWNQFSWAKFMRDSSFSIAISNNAVYVAGHFCKIDSGPGATATLSPNSGPSDCTGSSDFFGGAWRTQIAALKLSDGTPLDWNPGADSGRGGAALTVVSRGLLAGFDGQRSDNIRVGTTAFYDFGADEDPRTDQSCTATVNGLDVDLTWDTIPEISSYVVRRNSSWIASPGNTSSYTDTPPAGTHTYYIRTNLDGVQWDTPCNPTVTVDEPADFQTCDAIDNGDGSITISWTAIPGENSYIVRRNGSYLVSAGNALTHTESPGAGVFTYVIRSRINGTTTNTTCNPTITVIDQGPGPQTCALLVDGNGDSVLNWTAIPGENSYIVRRNGTYLASAGNTLTYTDTNFSPGDSYTIRSRMGGVTTNTTCQ